MECASSWLQTHLAADSGSVLDVTGSIHCVRGFCFILVHIVPEVLVAFCHYRKEEGEKKKVTNTKSEHLLKQKQQQKNSRYNQCQLWNMMKLMQSRKTDNGDSMDELWHMIKELVLSKGTDCS